MKKHIKIYFDYYGYGIDDIILCENCKSKATDIHHVLYKSQGGEDTIKNIIALCRDCHDKAHREILKRDYLQEIHNKNL